MREGILVEVDNVATADMGNRSDRGLSLRDLDRALSQIHEERRRVLLLIGLEGTSYEEREDSARSVRACHAAAGRSASLMWPEGMERRPRAVRLS